MGGWCMSVFHELESIAERATTVAPTWRLHQRRFESVAGGRLPEGWRPYARIGFWKQCRTVVLDRFACITNEFQVVLTTFPQVRLGWVLVKRA